MTLATHGTSFGASAWAVAALAGVAFLAERQSVHIAAHLQMSVSALPILFAAIAFGPFPAMLVAAAALLTSAGLTRDGRFGHFLACSGRIGRDNRLLLLGPHASFGRLLLAVAAAAVVEALTDILLTALTLIFRRKGSLAETWAAMSRLLLCTVPLYTPVIGSACLQLHRAFALDRIAVFRPSSCGPATLDHVPGASSTGRRSGRREPKA